MDALYDVPLILAAATLVAGFLLTKRWWDRRTSDVWRLPKPVNPHWLWGHEKTAWEEPDSAFHLRNVEELGSAFAMKGALFHPDILVVADPGALYHMFTKRSYDYVKSPAFRPFIYRLTGHSLIWVEGEEHKRQRQLLSPIFTHERVRLMTDNVRQAADAVVAKLCDHCHTGGQQTRVNILEWCNHPTLDIIGSVGFGYDFQCGEDPAAKTINEVWDNTVSNGFAFSAFLGPIIIRAFPWIGNLPIKPLQSQGQMRMVIRDLGRKIYAGRQLTDEKGGNDLISRLMALEEAGSNLDEVLDQITAFTLAGKETTARALGLALHELSLNQDLQRRLRDEVTAFRGLGPGGEATYTELQTKLPLLDAVCKETLRFWPTVAITERMATKDDVIKLTYPVETKHGLIDSLKISKGQVIILPSIAINRNTQVWGHDAHIFRPDRWLEPGGVPDNLTSGIYGTFTFLEGPRTCIGYRLGVFEIKVALLSFVRNFEFTPTGDKIAAACASTNGIHPFVVGQKEKGVQLPLLNLWPAPDGGALKASPDAASIDPGLLELPESVLVCYSRRGDSSNFPPRISHGQLRGLTTTAAVALALSYFLTKRWLEKGDSDVSRLLRPAGSHWFWGHEKAAWETPGSMFHVRNVEEIGPLYAMKGALFHPGLLVVADPVALNHIFVKHSYDYIKSPVFRPFVFRLAGKSLVWVEGDQHRQQRQTLSPIFTTERVKLMAEEVRRAMDTVVEKLRNHCNQQTVRIDAHEWANHPTMDVIGSVGFGYDFQCGEDPEAKAISEAWDRSMSMGLGPSAFIGSLVLRAFPWIGNVPVKALQSQGEVRTALRVLGRRLYANRQSGAGEERDLMSRLMSLEEAGLDLDEVIDQITGFTLAGKVTTSISIAMGLFELSRNPDLQRRLRKEVSEFQGSGPGGEATYAELQTKLSLLDAFCKETLRFWPPVPITERMATKGDVIQLQHPIETTAGYTSTVKVKKGQIIVFPTVAINRSTRMWGADANIFRPERWLDPQGISGTQTSGIFGTLTFSDGPRTCIGYRLAIFEIRVAILSFVKNFEFSPTGDTIQTICAATNAMQPFVVGHKEQGVQLPLLVKPIDGDGAT